jgi:hypothetical protein
MSPDLRFSLMLLALIMAREMAIDQMQSRIIQNYILNEDNQNEIPSKTCLI